MGAMEGCAVIAFARAPVLGQVKTRLAAGIGDENALEVYQQCSACVLQEAMGSGAAAFCFHPDPQEQSLVAAWLLSLQLTGMHIRSQAKDPDLGARMLAAIQQMHGLGYSKILVVGTDVPDITAEVLQQAFAALGTHDVVFGPAYDGGYYLVGMKQPQDSVFLGVPWSSQDTLKCSLKKARAAGLDASPLTAEQQQPGAAPQVHQTGLPYLHDIDTKQDLERWHARSKLKHATHPLHKLAQRILEQY